jgi:hypothetical protein
LEVVLLLQLRQYIVEICPGKIGQWRRLTCWGVEERDKAHELLPQSQKSVALFRLNNIFPLLKEPQKLKYAL